jgi:hypothetical protein
MCENTVRFTKDKPIAHQHYGGCSPLLVMNDLVFEFKISNDDMEELCNFFNNGDIPSIIPMSWIDLDKYLDIPILSKLVDESWMFGGDQYLWLLKLKNRQADGCFEPPKWINKPRNWNAADWSAQKGHLETLKWARENGEVWTHWAADFAASNGHLETLQWIRANGGEWTSDAADSAAERGHFETLKWIHANGGEWTSDAADSAAGRGDLETLQWIRANGGEWTSDAADGAAYNGHVETLQWIRANGGEWTSDAADGAAYNGHVETLQWIRANGGEWIQSAVFLKYLSTTHDIPREIYIPSRFLGI